MRTTAPYLAALALTTLTLAGCPKRPIVDAVTAPSDPLPLIIASLESGAELSYLAAELARGDSDLAGCIAGHSIAAALTTASEGVRGNIDGGRLPAIDYDISPCLEMLTHGEGDPPQGEDVPLMVQPMVDTALAGVSALVASYKAQLKCEDHAWAQAGLAYARGATPAIIAEVESPDGSISIPGVDVGLEACEED